MPGDVKLVGGSYRVKTTAKPVALGDLAGIQAGQISGSGTFLAPGSTSKTPNASSIFVGINRTADFELVPGSAVDYTDADPANLMVDGQGTAGLICMIMVGGTPMRWPGRDPRLDGYRPAPR